MTLCKSEILPVECDFCTKTDQECECAKIQTMIISSIKKLQAAKSDCKIYENKLYSVKLENNLNKNSVFSSSWISYLGSDDLAYKILSS